MPTPINNDQPTLALTQYMSEYGVYPSNGGGGGGGVGAFMGMLHVFAGNFTPGGTNADGHLMAISENDALFSIIGTTYGGDGITTFGAPDLAGRLAVGTSNSVVLGEQFGSDTITLNHAQMPVSQGGSSQPIADDQPSTAIHYMIALYGIFPSRDGGSSSNDFMGTVAQFAGNYSPPGWAECDGQLLPIAQNQALFALLGTTYGGDGRTTFGLPDLRGKTVVGAGGSITLGETFGSDTATLTNANLPVASGGGGQPVNNDQPSLALNYMIAVTGIFPPRDGVGADDEQTPYLGEILTTAVNFVPGGFLPCDGRLLSIAQNTALFSILGTTYGGDGRTTFALPNLIGRAVIGTDDTHFLGQEDGSDTFTLNVSDLAEVAPIASGASASINEDTVLNGSVHATDANLNPVSYSLGTDAAHGHVVVNADGTYSYTPNANYHGTDSFTFTASDGAMVSNAATVSLTVNSVNDAPLLTGSQTVLAHGTQGVAYVVAAADLLAGYTDADGDTMTVTNLTSNHGTVTDNHNGTFTITAPVNFSGAVTLNYTVDDGQSGTTAATESYVIDGNNHAPVANASAPSINEDAVLNGSVTASDADNDPLTYAVATGPAHGTLDFHTDGSYTYTPVADYNGPDSFTFTANDGTVNSAPATVSLTVNPVNDAPVANVSSASTDEDNALNGNVTASDADNDPLTYAVATGPAHGTLDFHTDGSYTYTPAADYNGPDSFTFTANDGTVNSAPAAVSLTVNPVNDAPVGGADSATVLAAGPRSIVLSATNLLTNDHDVDGDTLSITGVSAAAAHGTVSFSTNGTADPTDDTLTYTPTVGYSGPDSFSYTLSDGHGGLAAVAVNITVQPAAVTSVYTAGTSGDDTIDKSAATITQLIAGNAGNDVLTGGSANDTLNGGDGNDILHGGAGLDTLTGGNGADQFFIDKADMASGVDKITDFQGAGNGDVAGDDKILLSGFSAAATVTHVSDQGNAHTYMVTDGAFTGTFIAMYAGNAILQAGDYVFTPPPPVTYHSPVAGADSATVLASGPRTITLSPAALMANDTDADNDPLHITGVTSALHGTVMFNDNGTPANFADDTITYTPTVGYSGSDSFSYLLTDGTNTVNGVVAVTVQAATATGPVYTSGTNGNDTFDFSGSSAIQLVSGQGGNDTITTGSAADTINGGDGNDVINGGLGKDMLTGGLGADTFVFTSADNDKVVDFSVADDSFALSHGAFAALTEQNAVDHILMASQFVIGTAATTVDQHIIYNASTGGLYYDADGSGAGAMVQIATLAKNLALTHDDFLVWA